MKQASNKTYWKRARKLWALSALLISSCVNCPEAEYGDLIGSIPSMKDKNKGKDLKGWTYETVVSKESKETHYYYHMPPEKPGSPVFVLLHGMFLDGKTFLNFGPLAEHFELVALELPYESSFYMGQREDFSYLLADFLEALNLKKIYLGGVSLGGRIAMIFMERNKDIEVEGLALMSTDIEKSNRELRTSKRFAKWTLRLTGNDDQKMVCLVKKVSDRQRGGAEPGEDSVFEVFSLKKPSFYREVLYSMINTERLTGLDNIRCPTIIIHGDEDSTVSIDKAEDLLEHIPGAKFVTIKGGEHDIAYSRADEVIGHLKKHFVKP